MKYENQIHFILIDRGFPAGIMCHAESRLFHGPETGYRRTSLEPLEIRVRPEDKISILVNSKDPLLMNLFNLPIISRQIGNDIGNIQ